jgi:transposase
VTAIICGIDVSSDVLDVHLRDVAQPPQRFANTAEGIAALAELCRQHGVELAVMEASGGYERLPHGLLWAQGIPTAIVNPRMVRDFAKSMGLLEKTDRIDAAMIAWFAQTRRIVAQPPASEDQARLAAWVRRLRQLVTARTAQQQELRLVTDPHVLAEGSETIAHLTRLSRDYEQRITQLIAADPLWARLDAAFREIKGVAARTVCQIMAELPEIGTVSAKAIGKLAGLAPLADDSGKRNGVRHIRGGRPAVRSILFVVAEVFRRHNPDFAAFHQRLIAAGKKKKVVRIALAHKLLTRLNAKARDTRHHLVNPILA